MAPPPSPVFTTVSPTGAGGYDVYLLSEKPTSGSATTSFPGGYVTFVPSTSSGDSSTSPSPPLVSGPAATSTPPVNTIPQSSTGNNSKTITPHPSSTSPGNALASKSTSGVPKATSGVPNHTVAGIVIGVAVGVALITFLATFLAIRRRRGSGGKRHRQRSDRDGGLVGTVRQQTSSSEPKQPLVTQTSSGPKSFDNFLPQSADDKTVQNEVKTVLDQTELHVENFYQNTQSSGSRLADAELAMFDSPYLPSSLASLLPQTNNRIPLIKHALAHFITACITTPSDTDWSLLPKDFVILPNAVRAGGSTKSTKHGFTQSMSRWRALTAYLRPNPLEDKTYIAQRERQINIIVQNFSTAFAPWQNPRYKDEERIHSLVAILKDAADKGIWLFSQPSEFQFQWRKLGPGRIAVAPALVKVTDERGQILDEPQVMIDMTVKKV